MNEWEAGWNTNNSKNNEHEYISELMCIIRKPETFINMAHFVSHKKIKFLNSHKCLNWHPLQTTGIFNEYTKLYKS